MHHVLRHNLSVDDAETRGLLWIQGFENLPDVRRGMKCSGPQAVRPNPVVEAAVINFHRNLARFTGSGGPVPMVRATE